MVKTEQRKIQSTRDYRLFARSEENRALDLKRHKKLYASMRQYGFLPCFPIVCIRNGAGPRIVKDGQHRLAIAEELGLPVHYTDETVDFDVAVINCTPKTWTLRDYAEKFIAHGKKDYAEGLEFASRHGVPLGTAFAMLSGTTTFSNIQDAFLQGDFRVKDDVWAECVGSTYAAMVDLSASLRTVRFLEACMAAARVDGFVVSRLLAGAKQCREKLVSYSTRDAFLEMMEYIYNFKRQKTIPLKFMAVQAMRERNACQPKDTNGKATKK
jgi:hypothetical protein